MGGLLLAVFATTAAGGHGSPSAAGGAVGPAPTVKAWTATLIDRRTGLVLWSKGSSRRLPPASCTKIMTALVVLEHVKKLGLYATVPAIPLPQEVGVALRPGDRITIQQALRALMVRSANDAALTLASYVSGSEKLFVKLMNARAAALKLKDTHFVNCRGRPVPHQYSCAADLAELGRVAMRDARFRDLVRIKHTVIRYPPDHAVPIKNHNRLLDYAWGDGIKAGATDVSGMVLVGSGKPGLVPLIVVTMHEPNRDQEVTDAVALFTWGSAQYARRTIVNVGDPVASLPLDDGGGVMLSARTKLVTVVRAAASVTIVVSAPASLPTRPAIGAVVGTATYVADGLHLGTVDLVAAAPAASSPAAR